LWAFFYRIYNGDEDPLGRQTRFIASPGFTPSEISAFAAELNASSGVLLFALKWQRKRDFMYGWYILFIASELS